MSQAQGLHRRIRSVKNAKQITKAMEVVAASRMRRVADSVAKTQFYAELASGVVSRITRSPEARHHHFLQPAPRGKSLYVIFSSDRGLAGAYNANVFSSALEAFTADQQTGNSPSVIVFGRKGARFFARFETVSLIGEYEDVDDMPDANVFAPVLEAIAHGLDDGGFGAVKLIYTQFNSAMTQTVQVKQLLPISLDEGGGGQATAQSAAELIYELEPTTDEVIDEAIRLYMEAQLISAKVNSSASEYAMRMMAMGSASRNASELIDDLTLELNASRQAAITQELAEITGGASAVKA